MLYVNVAPFIYGHIPSPKGDVAFICKTHLKNKKIVTDSLILWHKFSFLTNKEIALCASPQNAVPIVNTDLTSRWHKASMYCLSFI